MIHLSKQEGYFYLRKIYRLLDDIRIKVLFEKMSKYAGLAIYEKSTILLDPREGILPVTIHECLHFLYQDWEEEKVALMTQKIFKVMSKAQTNHLMNRLTLALNRSFPNGNGNGNGG